MLDIISNYGQHAQTATCMSLEHWSTKTCVFDELSCPFKLLKYLICFETLDVVLVSQNIECWIMHIISFILQDSTWQLESFQLDALTVFGFVNLEFVDTIKHSKMDFDSFAVLSFAFKVGDSVQGSDQVIKEVVCPLPLNVVFGGNHVVVANY